MSDHDEQYYHRRERQERASAARCDDRGAQRIHLELANRYAALRREAMPISEPIAARF